VRTRSGSRDAVLPAAMVLRRASLSLRPARVRSHTVGEGGSLLPAMDASPSISLRMPLPLPSRGQSTRVRVGTSELVLESVRGGHSLLWSDGRSARRYSLGLPDDGVMELRFCAPKFPLRVVPRDVLALVPRARLSGYLQVPLVPTLRWLAGPGPGLDVIELAPNDLQAEWDESQGPWQRCASSLHVRFPMRSGEAKVVVPVHVKNLGRDVLSPPFLPLHLTDADLREKRDSIVVAPRRLVWNGEAFAAVAAAGAFRAAGRS
jgi:hypothetical protein